MPVPVPNIDLPSRDFVEVIGILQKQVPDLEVWAFGSRAKGTAKPYSDLDLALMTTRPLSIEQSAILKEAFDVSDLPIRVDVVDFSAVSASFQKIIEQNKVVLQRAKKRMHGR